MIHQEINLLRIDVAYEGPNAYQDIESESYSESATDIILLTITQKHEMFGEDELESEGDNETDLGVSQDTDTIQKVQSVVYMCVVQSPY